MLGDCSSEVLHPTGDALSKHKHSIREQHEPLQDPTCDDESRTAHQAKEAAVVLMKHMLEASLYLCRSLSHSSATPETSQAAAAVIKSAIVSVRIIGEPGLSVSAAATTLAAADGDLAGQ